MPRQRKIGVACQCQHRARFARIAVTAFADPVKAIAVVRKIAALPALFPVAKFAAQTPVKYGLTTIPSVRADKFAREENV